MSKIIAEPKILNNIGFKYNSDLKLTKKLTSPQARLILGEVINHLYEDRLIFSDKFNEDHILFLKDFLLLSPKIERLTKYQKALIINHPLFNDEEKLELLKKVQSGRKTNPFKDISVVDELCNFLTLSGIEFMKRNYHFQDLKKVIRKSKLKPLLSFPRSNEPVLYYEMYFNSKSFRKIKEENKEDLILNLSACKMFDIRKYFSKEEITKSFLNLVNRTTEKKDHRLLSSASYDNYPEIYNDILKAKYNNSPILDLFSNLKELVLQWENCPSMEITSIKYNGIKEFLKENAGFCSGSLINYIKKQSNNLENGMKLIKILSLLKDHLKDHNLTWQALKGNWKNLTFEDISNINTICNIPNFLTPTQIVKLFQNIEKKESLSSIPRDICRLLKINPAEIISHDFSQNTTLNSLKNNYRFNDYNSFNKLHDILSLLYTKEKTKKSSLEVFEKFPSLKELDNVKLITGETIVVPQFNHDLLEWGQKLKICIGSYSDVALSGECVLLGLSIESKIAYCIEIQIRKNEMVIRQFNGFGNKRAPKEVISNFNLAFNKVKDKLLEENILLLEAGKQRLLELLDKSKKHISNLEKECQDDNDQDAFPIIQHLKMTLRHIAVTINPSERDNDRHDIRLNHYMNLDIRPYLPFMEKILIKELEDLCSISRDDIYMMGNRGGYRRMGIRPFIY